MYSKLCEEHNIRQIAESLYIFLTTPNEVEKDVKMMQPNSSDNCIHCYNIEILNLSYPELQLINTKSMIKKN